MGSTFIVGTEVGDDNIDFAGPIQEQVNSTSLVLYNSEHKVKASSRATIVSFFLRLMSAEEKNHLHAKFPLQPGFLISDELSKKVLLHYGFLSSYYRSENLNIRTIDLSILSDNIGDFLEDIKILLILGTRFVRPINSISSIPLMLSQLKGINHIKKWSDSLKLCGRIFENDKPIFFVKGKAEYKEGRKTIKDQTGKLIIKVIEIPNGAMNYLFGFLEIEDLGNFGQMLINIEKTDVEVTGESDMNG